MAAKVPPGCIIRNARNVSDDASMFGWGEIYCVVRGLFCCRNGTNANTLQGESRLFGILQTISGPNDGIFEKGEGTEGEVQLQGWGLLREEQTFPLAGTVERVRIPDPEIIEGETIDRDEIKRRNIIRSAGNKVIGIWRNTIQRTDEGLLK